MKVGPVKTGLFLPHGVLAVVAQQCKSIAAVFEQDPYHGPGGHGNMWDNLS